MFKPSPSERKTRETLTKRDTKRETIPVTIQKVEEKPERGSVEMKEKLKLILVDLDDIIHLRVMCLDGLISGYRCSSSRRFRPSFPSGIVPSGFEGVWECCLLGCDGWGCAYLCSSERVVFKTPRGFEAIIEGGEIPTVHSSLLKKIKHEAEVMSSLNHPNIIRLLGVSEKAPLVIYEFANYGSLYWQFSKG